jgi:Icc-related predicted phosphoesterase
MAKVCFVSDTHNAHDKLNLEPVDIIIHSGDATGMGHETQLKNFIEWYAEQDAEHKIYVPGNHDIGLEEHYEERSKWFEEAGIILLNDESVILDDFSYHDFEDYNIKIYGSPITPNFGRWSFMRARGHQINEHWKKIPEDTDILVTHGPPKYILDQVINTWDDQASVGCEMLAKRVIDVKPKIHAFGHIHEGYGTAERYGTEFINASIMDEGYILVNDPVYRNIN